MANKVNPTPPVSSPIRLDTIPSVSNYLLTLVFSLVNALQEHAATINALVDLQTVPQGPVILKSYLKAALPSAADGINGLIIVSNETGGLTPAFSDGTNWRRVADRAIVS